MAISVWRFGFPRSGPLLFFCGLIESCGCFSKTLQNVLYVCFFALMCMSILYCENRDFCFTWNVGLAPKVYLILFYAMGYIVKRLLLYFSSLRVPLHEGKNVVTIALTAKFKPICHSNKRNSLYMSGWMDECALCACIWHQNLWNRAAKAVFIGPLIYAELRARDVAHWKLILLFSLRFRHELTNWKLDHGDDEDGQKTALTIIVIGFWKCTIPIDYSQLYFIIAHIKP